MATSSFDRKIELDELSAKRLKKVLNTKKKVEIEDIDVEEQLKEGKEIMAVSLGIIRCLDKEAAKIFLKDLEKATLNPKIFKDASQKLKEIEEKEGL